jgi:hypothetical protein
MHIVYMYIYIETFYAPSCSFIQTCFPPTVLNFSKFVRNIVKAGQDKIARIVPRLSASAAALCQIPNTIEY